MTVLTSTYFVAVTQGHHVSQLFNGQLGLQLTTVEIGQEYAEQVWVGVMNGDLPACKDNVTT